MSSKHSPDLLKRIKEAIDTIRPHLLEDGGDVEVVEIRSDGILVVRFTGACEHCSMLGMTLEAGVNAAVVGKVPEISGVVAV